MSQYSKEKLASLPVRTVYRQLLKKMKYYPSKNRFGIMLAVKEEFHKNKDLTEERAIFVERKKAWMGLAHVLYYIEKMDELNKNYALMDRGITESLNPKDKDFIYF